MEKFLTREVCGYCATCDRELGDADIDFLGRRIQCGAKKTHFARVIPKGDESAKWWLRRELWLKDWQTRYSAFPVLKRLLAKRIEVWAGRFLLLCFLVIFGALATELLLPSWAPWARLLFGPLLLYRFVDVFLSNTSIVFTSQFPANPLRSIVLSFAAFFQIVLCYGYFYWVLGDWGAIGPQKGETSTVIEAVYYSVGTIATVGYGVLEPKNELGKLVVASELLLGLYFVVIILAQVGTWASQSRGGLDIIAWETVKKREK